MIYKLLTKFFGSKNDRELKKLESSVCAVAEYESKMKEMSDFELKQQTDFLRRMYENNKNLDELLPEAFATVREASVRTLGLRHYDVQILGGIVLHRGKIAEMKTGEGKTLVATLSAYLNAITGNGVHIVTVNDYLASRDTNWMGNLYNFLGMTVGTLKQGMSEKDRKEAYGADITYGTNNEFGFDYLRDNMKFEKSSIVQRGLYFSIVDEVDSILIDEARTPLIISGPDKKTTDVYSKVNKLFNFINTGVDYKIDEKGKRVLLTDKGISKIEEILKIKNIYDSKYIELLHHINQNLKANSLFKKDVDYIVKNGEVIIVDEFTGRLMPGRRYSDGLHQALEAKENVKINNENQTLATITFQNYFRMYKKLSGMTGTADTEASEFKKIYDLDVVVVPTNKPMIRNDMPDLIYVTREEKFKSIVSDIIYYNKSGRPVLVGTVSIESSEKLSKKLKKYKIKHSVLNAKHHKKEAEIIALAGYKGSVTISTNMAGRGTDIVLGSTVDILGGLHIIGTERHESRRIDNQLRGRAGRQGDPGSSRFYLSLEDDLLRIFGGEKITSIMEKLGMNKGKAIEHVLVTKSIENAQSKVENHNFNLRKHLLEYDDVLNQQRKIIYNQRNNLLMGWDIKSTIEDILSDKVKEFIAENIESINSNYDFDIEQFKSIINILIKRYKLDNEIIEKFDFIEITNDKLYNYIYKIMLDQYYRKELKIGINNFRELERVIMLRLVDNLWKDHLANMEHLKEGIGLRGYAQQNPLFVYKKEGFEMFQKMINRIRNDTVEILFRTDLDSFDEFFTIDKKEYNNEEIAFSDAKKNNLESKTFKRNKEKIGRNYPCPCGSRKKYKKCCGS